MSETESEIPNKDLDNKSESTPRLHRAVKKIRGVFQSQREETSASEGELPYPDTDPYVWQRDEDEPSLEESEIGLDVAYEDLIHAESREPHPKERIYLRKDLSDEERAQLLATDGITEQDVDSRSLRREQLLAAGFTFVNSLGDGEKGIISGDFPDPDDPDTVLNLGNRTILTQDEVRKVYEYQQQHPDVYGLHGEDMEEVRKDMLSFLSNAVNEPVMKHADLQASLVRGFRIVGSDADWDALEAYFASRAAEYRAAHPDYAKGSAGEYTPDVESKIEFARQYCSDLYDPDITSDAFGGKEVRGHHLTALRIRRKKLAFQPSPFLESGFTFGDNPDVLISGMPSPENDERNIGMRMNMATVHLAGAHPDFPGFSEMGGTNDQVYMPTGRYITELYPRDEAEREAVHSRESSAFRTVSLTAYEVEIQRRAIRIAREWQAAQPAPRKEKRLTWGRRRT